MRHRLSFLAGAAVGYVLGAQAGRERYEQLKRLSRQVTENQSVQDAAGALRNRAGDLAGTAKDRLVDTAKGRLDTAKERLNRRGDDEEAPESEPHADASAG